ncbi:3-methylornithyl-N6-L-lysine dehydrogenase PylD [Sporomusa sp. KB1]|jgi:pyrrolysine biosynthesis protein PylD|uniref:3-methylornithyl-N6-L-lysine dehydrogenase PylD n=1 Tax=Sporomusa sp. KB1 TaxID=943346 RepID=UPI0011A9FDE7|nr:3-methylornithyl-N6-L-lysine dehydrogenase PylD [Sporomusa sp. KB1]TWH45122.1 pyrrolysine biosynthesis protein PylD [Sporomusa sp. KB1]
MTRLKEDDISKISTMLTNYDSELIRKTGCSLREIAASAANRNAKTIFSPRPKVAVIPMTCGEGIIPGFAESVASILNYLSFTAFTTANCDVAGIYEAMSKGANILFTADDNQFVAINLCNGAMVSNSEATGKGYIAGLARMCDGLANKHVLLIGAGAVGKGAAWSLARLGALVSIYDISLPTSQRLVNDLVREGYPAKVETDLECALTKHCIILDASPAKDIIHSRYITGDTVIAAPGIPLGITEVSRRQLSGRVLHDPLQIGVATMIFEVL